MKNVSNIFTAIVSNTKGTLKDICVSNNNRLIFLHLNVKSLRKFDFRFE